VPAASSGILDQFRVDTGTEPRLRRSSQSRPRSALCSGLGEQLQKTQSYPRTDDRALWPIQGDEAVVGAFRKRTEYKGELTDFEVSQRQATIWPTILVVEDEVLLRMVISDELRNVGYTVIEVADAQEALDALAHKFDVKLIVSDIQLPGAIGGLELAQLVRASHPAIKIVLTSGRFGDGGAEHDGFFQKPYDTNQLINHIATLLNEAAPV
jgi:CheY-like chemotaxis protein